MTRIGKKIFLCILSLALTLMVWVVGIFPTALPIPAKATTVLSYEQTNVMDDLRNATIDGKPFSVTDYPFDEKKDTRVLSLVEYCYSFYEEKQGNYNLYVYVYNPKGLMFDVGSPLNGIQLSYALVTTANYKKYPLRFVNYSVEPNYERLFYKFKVVLSSQDKQDILSILNSSARTYRVSGIELLEKDKTNATEFTVGRTYTYSGYAAGYGSNPTAENTLSCKSEDMDVLSLKVSPTVYRPSGTNGKNNYTQDSLHSVYFAVPNTVIEEYGAMTAIHAIWRNAVIKPSLVTGNYDAYNGILPYLGDPISKQDVIMGYGSVLPYMYLGAFHKGPTIAGAVSNTFDYSFNCDTNSFHVGMDSSYTRVVDGIGDNINPLYMMFYTGGASADTYTLNSETLLAKMREYSRHYGGMMVNGKYSEELFESVDKEYTEVNVQADEEFSLTSEKITSNWWEKIWGTSHVASSTTFNGIQAIYPVKASDMVGTAEEVSNRLYILQSDYASFYEYYSANKADSTVYLFRYQVSDYMAQEAKLLKDEDNWKEKDSNAYFFQQTVNLDFDVIDVTFSNGYVNTVIPVVSDPIDVVPNATPPVLTTSDGDPSWLRWLKLAVMLLLIGGLVILLWPVLSPLLGKVGKFIVWLLSLPFKGIKKLFSRRKKGGKGGDGEDG